MIGGDSERQRWGVRGLLSWLLENSYNPYSYITLTRDCVCVVCCAVTRLMKSNQLPHLLFYGPPGISIPSYIRVLIYTQTHFLNLD